MSFPVAKLLTAAGAAVATFGAIAMTIGLKFSVPPQVYTIVVYKAIFAAAAGLLIVGAMAGRHAHEKRKAEELERKGPEPELEPGSPISAPDFLARDSREHVEPRD